MTRGRIWTGVFATCFVVFSLFLFNPNIDGQTAEVEGTNQIAQAFGSQPDYNLRLKTSQDNNHHIFGDEDDGTPREDKAEVNIKAPDKVKVGDMIVIDLSESLGGGFDFAVEPMPPNLKTFNDGKIIVCGTGNKNVTYTFMISCALDGDSDISVHKVKVTGAAAPGPPPDPGQNVVEKVKDWADGCDSPDKRDDAIKLAQSFASVAIIIEQDQFSTPAELVQATATSNRDALGDNLEHWTPLLDGLMTELKAMAQLGKLQDVKDHARIWRDVSKGLKEYAASLE